MDPTRSSADALAERIMPSPPIELAVVIPTYNESENIPLLLVALGKALRGIEWEVVFVDDNSPDKTAELIRVLALTNRRIRVLERIGRRGLSSACIEGMLATPAPYIAVMDADMQHDESILPRMLERMKSEHLDVVVGSRKIEGGSMGEFARERIWLSDLGTRISKLVCRCDVSDAMSGFFMVDRAYFQQVVPRLTGAGFSYYAGPLRPCAAVTQQVLGSNGHFRKWVPAKLFFRGNGCGSRNPEAHRQPRNGHAHHHDRQPGHWRHG